MVTGSSGISGLTGGNCTREEAEQYRREFADIEGRDGTFPDSRSSAAVPTREERALEDTPRCAGCGQPFWPAPHRAHRSHRAHGETHCRYCRNALLVAETQARWSNVQDIR